MKSESLSLENLLLKSKERMEFVKAIDLKPLRKVEQKTANESTLNSSSNIKTSFSRIPVPKPITNETKMEKFLQRENHVERLDNVKGTLSSKSLPNSLNQERGLPAEEDLRKNAIDTLVQLQKSLLKSPLDLYLSPAPIKFLEAKSGSRFDYSLVDRFMADINLNFEKKFVKKSVKSPSTKENTKPKNDKKSGGVLPPKDKASKSITKPKVERPKSPIKQPAIPAIIKPKPNLAKRVAPPKRTKFESRLLKISADRPATLEFLTSSVPIVIDVSGEGGDIIFNEMNSQEFKSKESKLIQTSFDELHVKQISPIQSTKSLPRDLILETRLADKENEKIKESKFIQTSFDEYYEMAEFKGARQPSPVSPKITKSLRKDKSLEERLAEWIESEVLLKIGNLGSDNVKIAAETDTKDLGIENKILAKSNENLPDTRSRATSDKESQLKSASSKSAAKVLTESVPSSKMSALDPSLHETEESVSKNLEVDELMQQPSEPKSATKSLDTSMVSELEPSSSDNEVLSSKKLDKEESRDEKLKSEANASSKSVVSAITSELEPSLNETKELVSEILEAEEEVELVGMTDDHQVIDAVAKSETESESVSKSARNSKESSEIERETSEPPLPEVESEAKSASAKSKSVTKTSVKSVTSSLMSELESSLKGFEESLSESIDVELSFKPVESAVDEEVKVVLTDDVNETESIMQNAVKSKESSEISQEVVSERLPLPEVELESVMVSDSANVIHVAGNLSSDIDSLSVSSRSKSMAKSSKSNSKSSSSNLSLTISSLPTLSEGEIITQFYSQGQVIGASGVEQSEETGQLSETHSHNESVVIAEMIGVSSSLINTTHDDLSSTLERISAIEGESFGI